MTAMFPDGTVVVATPLVTVVVVAVVAGRASLTVGVVGDLALTFGSVCSCRHPLLDQGMLIHWVASRDCGESSSWGYGESSRQRLLESSNDCLKNLGEVGYLQDSSKVAEILV